MKFFKTLAGVLGLFILSLFTAGGETPASPLYVVVKNPVTVPMTRGGVQIGSVSAPAGSKFEVVGQKDGKFSLKHSTGGMVELPVNEVQGTDYRQLVGVWEVPKKTWFYEFKEDGTVVRACLTYPLNDPVPFGVKTEDFKVATTPEKLLITLPPGWGVLELPIPFDLEKPQFVQIRDKEGRPNVQPFPLSKVSPEQTSARAAAEGILKTKKLESPAGGTTTPTGATVPIESAFEIEVAGVKVSVKRLGSGPVGVILFAHSGSKEMVQYLERNASWFGDLSEKCSIFFWEYPQTAPFDQVASTLDAYQKDSAAKLSFAGTASNVVTQIRQKSGLKDFLIMGNSLGAGIVLQDYPKLVGDETLSFLFISPSECFMPEIETIGSVKRTTILAAKGIKNEGGITKTDRFLKGDKAWNWVSENLTTEWCDLIARGGASDRVTVRLGNGTTATRGPSDYVMGHYTIGGEVNAELLAKIIRVKLGLADKSILAESPRQKNIADLSPAQNKPKSLLGKQTSVTIHLLTRDGRRALHDENGKEKVWDGKEGEGVWVIPAGTKLEVVKELRGETFMQKALVQYTKEGVTEQFWAEAPWFQNGSSPQNYVERMIEFEEKGRTVALFSEIGDDGKTYNMIDRHPLLYANPKGYFELADGKKSQLHIGRAYHPAYLEEGKVLFYEKTEPLLQRTKELREVPDFNQVMKFVAVPKPVPFTEKEIDALILKLRETGLENSGYPIVEIPVKLRKQTHLPDESPWSASLWVEAENPLVDRSKPISVIAIDQP